MARGRDAAWPSMPASTTSSSSHRILTWYGHCPRGGDRAARLRKTRPRTHDAPTVPDAGGETDSDRLLGRAGTRLDVLNPVRPTAATRRDLRLLLPHHVAAQMRPDRRVDDGAGELGLDLRP